MQPADTITSYFVDDLHFPYCKGCSHSQALRALDQAMVRLQLAPSDVDITTDIGCVGLADSLFNQPHTVHTTHGRSTAFATGTVIADRVLGDGRLKPVVLIGDGGAMIGLLHIVHAAQMNADVTVLLHNNFLFGMTGGQNSAFSPLGLITTTTKSGNIVPPIDLCQIALDCGAGFVARKYAADRDLAQTIAAAIAHPGFALVEIIELCTAFGTRLNELSGSRLKEMTDEQGLRTGILRHSTERKEFGGMYREKFPVTQPVAADDSVTAVSHHHLGKHAGMLIGGTAGERVQSSARLLCQAALLCGCHVTQKNDNPVTQGTGFSLSEVCVSPEPILYTGIESADAVIIVSADGLAQLNGRGVFERLGSESIVIADAQLSLPPAKGRVISLPLRRQVSGKLAAATAIGLYLKMSGVLPIEAYAAALTKAYGDPARTCLAAIETFLP